MIQVFKPTVAISNENGNVSFRVLGDDKRYHLLCTMTESEARRIFYIIPPSGK